MYVQIESSWKELLHEEFEKPYFANIVNFLKHEKQQGQTIYPKGRDIFNTFAKTPFYNVKIVIIGQDPYHGKGQAHGLSFSVAKNMPIPPSLMNIFKELNTDVGITMPTHGNLEHWALQGVMLLNATLTVRANQPASHASIGWQIFTDRVIKIISEQKEHIVFLLWGSYARQKANIIDSNRHLILTAAHPSPLSAHQGFMGCQHFSKANEYLYNHGISVIDWQI